MAPAVLEHFVEISSKSLSQALTNLGGARVDRYKLAVVLRTAVALAQFHRDCWKAVQDTLKEKAFEANDLAETCLFLLAEARENKRSFDLIQQLVPDNLPADSELLVLFRQLSDDIQAVLDSEQPIKEWFDLATKRPAPVDEARIREGLAAIEAGRFKKGRDLIEQLRQPK
jgi:hypothetical protein